MNCGVAIHLQFTKEVYMRKLEVKTALKNGWFNNKNITNDELSIYTLILDDKVWSQDGFNYSKVNISDINDRIYHSIGGSKRRNYNAIKETIKSLLDKELIYGLYNTLKEEVSIEDVTSNNNFYVSTEQLTSEYFVVNQSEITRLLSTLEGTKVSKFQILRYYIALQRVISNSDKFGYLSQDSITFIKSHKTVTQYNEILSTNGFIIYNNDYMTKDGKWAKTYFGDVDNPSDFNAKIRQLAKESKYIDGDKPLVNKKIGESVAESRKSRIDEVVDNPF